MRPKTYHVTLTDPQRAQLNAISHSYRYSERERKRVRILLLADEAQPEGPATDNHIAAQVNVCLPTVQRVRQRFAQHGLQTAVHRKEQDRRKPRTLDGEAEAFLVALTCSAPPPRLQTLEPASLEGHAY